MKHLPTTVPTAIQGKQDLPGLYQHRSQLPAGCQRPAVTFERLSPHLSSQFAWPDPVQDTRERARASPVRSSPRKLAEKVEHPLLSGSPSATRGRAKRREVESTSNFTFYRCCKRQECFFPNAGSYNCGRGQTDRRLLREKAKPFLVKSWCFAVCPSPAPAKDEPRINRGTIGSHRCPRFSLPANGRKPNINRQRNSGTGRARRGKTALSATRKRSGVNVPQKEEEALVEPHSPSRGLAPQQCFISTRSSPAEKNLSGGASPWALLGSQQ